MRRYIYNDLLAWKNSVSRVPLILRGARQVGKSYILEEFGRREYAAYHRFDFEKNQKELLPLFKDTISPDKLIEGLSLLAGIQISVESDLVILDEIQNCPEALTSLKYFCEDLPELHLCAAGSLLGITLTDASFPVGKVCYLDLYPLSFDEFLYNSGDSMLYDAFVSAGDSSVLHDKLWDILKEYYVVGGMPRIVEMFFSKKGQKAEGMLQARRLQSELVDTYTRDFSKHSGKNNALHIKSVFENIPIQLASHVNDSTQRFRFKDVIPGKKGFSAMEGPIEWLVQSGLIYKVPICNKAQIPMKAFTKHNIFKLYIFDIGILGCMLDLSPQTLVLQDYGLIKGYFAENFVASQLVSSGEHNLYSWSERNSEIEFLLDVNSDVVPVEVKSGLRTKAQSLRQYIIKYDPACAVIISGKPLSLEKRVKNYPLYYSGRLRTCLMSG